MGAQGTAILDFGSFPGSNVATVDTAAAGVVAASAVEAWIRPAASADHTVEDHLAAAMKIVGAYLSDNNIRITGLNTNDVIPPLEPQPNQGPTKPRGSFVRMDRQNAPMLVGHWVWN